MSLSILAQTYYEDGHISIQHSRECSIPGYFVLRLKERCTSLSTLETKSYLEVMMMLKNTYQIVEDVIKPEKIYICSFCELDPQLHFHILPRSKHLTEKYVQAHKISSSDAIDGPKLFKWAREQYMNPLSQDEESVLRDQFIFHFANKLQSLASLDEAAV